MSGRGDVAVVPHPNALPMAATPLSPQGAAGLYPNGVTSPFSPPKVFPLVVPPTDGGCGLGSHEYWERLVASGSRLEPNRSSISWMPDEPPEPDALAPTARAFYYDMLAQDLEALTLKRRFEASGLFGVGLQVSDDPPHVVQRVSRLLDSNRRNVSDTVSIGDTLYSVNDFQVEMSSIDTVEQLIFGDLSSTVRLTFCDRNRQKYDVTAIRHVPISVWERERVWYEIKPEFLGKELRCDPSIINLLETIRALISKSGAVPEDLLKDFSHVQTTLGFRIGVKSVDGRLMSCVVQQVIPGSAADQGSGLQPGDMIVAVNGVNISDWDETRLLEAFRGEDIIGSKCRITIERPSAKQLGLLDVDVLRTNAAFAKEVELLFLLGQEHAALLEARMDYEALNSSLQAMMHQAVALERHRILHEQVLASRLRSIQGRILESVTEAEKRIKPASDVGNKERIEVLEERWKYWSELSMLLKEPPAVSPSNLARAMRSAKVGGNDLMRILEAMSEKNKSTDEVVDLIRGDLQAKCARQEQEISELRAQLKAAQAPKVCAACGDKDQKIKELNDEIERLKSVQVQRAQPARSVRSAPPPPTTPPPDAPSIVPPGGKFDKTCSTTITSEVPGAKIYYTTNGSQPTQTNFEQTGSSPLVLKVENTMSLRAMCFANGKASQLAEAEFIIEPPPAQLAGVGLLLEKHEKTREVTIKKIISGGAADLDGTLKLKDQLLRVDGQSVQDLGLEQILSLIKGAEGTLLKMDFRRDENNFGVELVRRVVSQVGVVNTGSKKTKSSKASTISTR